MIPPTITPITDTPRFSSERKDQAQLARCASEWVSVGANVVISNSDTPYIRELYPTSKWTLTSVSVKRHKLDGAERKNADELIISNV